ncbi:hypothetical protein Trydic_g11089 [Trypoxylus dichotomus]
MRDPLDPTGIYVQNMLQSQENLSDVLAIREVLLEKALRQCHEREIWRRTISYMARCAYKAMLQIIDLQFYVHDHGKDDFVGDPEWIPDKEPEPSPPDTWAAYNVPVVVSEDTEDISEDQFKISQQQSSEMAVEIDSGAIAYSTRSLISSELHGSHTISEYSECLLGPNVSEEILPVEEEESTIADTESEKSLFTRIATLDTDIDTSRLYGDYKRRETFKLPRIQKLFHETKPKPAELKISTFTFPPLRAETILQRSPSPAKNEKQVKKSASSNAKS